MGWEYLIENKELLDKLINTAFGGFFVAVTVFIFKKFIETYFKKRQDLILKESESKYSKLNDYYKKQADKLYLIWENFFKLERIINESSIDESNEKIINDSYNIIAEILEKDRPFFDPEFIIFCKCFFNHSNGLDFIKSNIDNLEDFRQSTEKLLSEIKIRLLGVYK